MHHGRLGTSGWEVVANLWSFFVTLTICLVIARDALPEINESQ